jgi:hypothetical protein
MLVDRIAQALELAVDSALAENGIEGARVEENVHVFREPLNQVPAFGKARPALENHLVADRPRDDPQGLGDVVVLFDERRSQPTLAVMASAPNGESGMPIPTYRYLVAGS